MFLSPQPKWAKCFSKFPWTLGNQAGFKVHSGVWRLGAVGRVLGGAGLSPILRATVHVLLHCRLVVIQLLTGEVVQLEKPTGLYDHIGAGVTRNSILGNGLEKKMRDSVLTVEKGSGECTPSLPRNRHRKQKAGMDQTTSTWSTVLDLTQGILLHSVTMMYEWDYHFHVTSEQPWGQG